MRKLLVPAAGLLALSLVLSACNVQLTPYAARVDGAVIAPSALNSAMSAIATNDGYLCEIDPSSSLAITGKGGSTYASSFAAVVLTQLVQYQSAHALVARMGLHPTAFARELAATDLPSQLTPSSTSGCTTTGAAILAGFSPSYRADLLQFETDELLLLAHLAGVTLTRTGIAAYEASHTGTSTESCTSVIEVSSLAAADAARREIAAGASFASVAKSSSLDTSTASKGGSLGCFLPSEFTAPLGGDVAALPVGQVSAPVPFSTGYLLLLVTSRPLAPLQQVASAAVLTDQAKLPGLLSGALGADRVSVDPRYGSWTHASSGWQVDVTSGPKDSLLPNPSAVTPSAASSSTPATSG